MSDTIRRTEIFLVERIPFRRGPHYDKKFGHNAKSNRSWGINIGTWANLVERTGYITTDYHLYFFVRTKLTKRQIVAIRHNETSKCNKNFKHLTLRRYL